MILTEALALERLRGFVKMTDPLWYAFVLGKPIHWQDLFEDALWLTVWGKHSAQRAFLAIAAAELRAIEERHPEVRA